MASDEFPVLHSSLATNGQLFRFRSAKNKMSQFGIVVLERRSGKKYGAY